MWLVWQEHACHRLVYPLKSQILKFEIPRHSTPNPEC